MSLQREVMEALPRCTDASGLAVARRMCRMYFRPKSDFWKRVLWRWYGAKSWTIRLTDPAGLVMSGRYNQFSDLHAVCEVFGQRVYRLDQVPVPPDLVVDAGAHLGSFSLLATRTFPAAQIVCFEPDTDNFVRLRANLERNAAGQVDSRPFALGKRDGTARLSAASSMGGRVSETDGKIIEIRRLSQQVDFTGVQRLLFKLDVEGSEWDVLEDCLALLPASTMMFVETHAGDADMVRLKALAAEHGFEFDHTNDKGECQEAVLRRGDFAGKS
jgi:FkbM family methyltransferase